MGNKEEYNQIPNQVLDEDLFVAKMSVGKEEAYEEKHGSLATISSVWSAMVGLGLLTIPWAYAKSGLILGLIITFTSFIISYYTCYLVLKVAGNDVDYTDTLKKYFGKAGWTAGMIIFILNFCVPVILYFQLLASNLCPIILAIVNAAKHEDV